MNLLFAHLFSGVRGLYLVIARLCLRLLWRRIESPVGAAALGAMRSDALRTEVAAVQALSGI